MATFGRRLAHLGLRQSSLTCRAVSLSSSSPPNFGWFLRVFHRKPASRTSRHQLVGKMLCMWQPRNKAILLVILLYQLQVKFHRLFWAACQWCTTRCAYLEALTCMLLDGVRPRFPSCEDLASQISEPKFRAVNLEHILSSMTGNRRSL